MASLTVWRRCCVVCMKNLPRQAAEIYRAPSITSLLWSDRPCQWKPFESLPGVSTFQAFWASGDWQNQKPRSKLAPVTFPEKCSLRWSNHGKDAKTDPITTVWDEESTFQQWLKARLRHLKNRLRTSMNASQWPSNTFSRVEMRRSKDITIHNVAQQSHSNLRRSAGNNTETGHLQPDSMCLSVCAKLIRETQTDE